jgi:hypothetical protein
MEYNQSPIQSGSDESSPSDHGKRGATKKTYANPTKPVRKNETSFDTDDEEGEINPAKLDREQTEPDSTGSDDSKAHEPYELKRKEAEKDKPELGKLVGQGGYGTSATSGTNSGGSQDHRTGLGTAGSQNGSSGYND